MPVEEVEDTTNEIERRLRKELPQMTKIFIEVDSRGDGRGVETAKSSRPRIDQMASALSRSPSPKNGGAKEDR
jgi:hypothetical protein